MRTGKDGTRSLPLRRLRTVMLCGIRGTLTPGLISTLELILPKGCTVTVNYSHWVVDKECGFEGLTCRKAQGK